LLTISLNFLHLPSVCNKQEITESVSLQLDGNIVAPNVIWTTTAANLLTFYRVNNLTVNGSGQMDGNGAIWWTCFNKKVGSSGLSRYHLLRSLPLFICNKLMHPLIFDRNAVSGQL
jgi:hypothetical protein